MRLSIVVIALLLGGCATVHHQPQHKISKPKHIYRDYKFSGRCISVLDRQTIYLPHTIASYKLAHCTGARI